MRGLTQDHNRQAKETRKMGGPTDALRRVKKRPGGTYNIRNTRKDGYETGLNEEQYNRIFGK